MIDIGNQWKWYWGEGRRRKVALTKQTAILAVHAFNYIHHGDVYKGGAQYCTLHHGPLGWNLKKCIELWWTSCDWWDRIQWQRQSTLIDSVYFDRGRIHWQRRTKSSCPLRPSRRCRSPGWGSATSRSWRSARCPTRRTRGSAPGTARRRTPGCSGSPTRGCQTREPTIVRSAASFLQRVQVSLLKLLCGQGGWLNLASLFLGLFRESWEGKLSMGCLLLFKKAVSSLGIRTIWQLAFGWWNLFDETF